MECINYFVSLNNSPLYAPFLLKMMSLYSNIISRFTENFQRKIFQFPKTPRTISRFGDHRDCSIIFH